MLFFALPYLKTVGAVEDWCRRNKDVGQGLKSSQSSHQVAQL